MDKNKCSKEINVTKAIWKLSYVKTANFSCKYDNYIWPFLMNANTYVFKIHVMDHNNFLFELLKKP